MVQRKKIALLLMSLCAWLLPAHSTETFWYFHSKKLFCSSAGGGETAQIVKTVEIPILKDRIWWFGNFVRSDFCIMSESPDAHYYTVSKIDLHSGEECRQYEIPKDAIVFAAFFTDDALYTLESDKNDRLRTLLKKRMKGENTIISSSHTAQMDFALDSCFWVEDLFVTAEGNRIVISLLHERGTYREKPYFAVLSADGTLLSWHNGRFLNFSAHDNKIYYSEQNRLFSAVLSENEKDWRPTEQKIGIGTKEEIVSFADLGGVYFIGTEMRRRNVLIDFLFGYGYITKNNYFLCSKTGGALEKKNILQSTVNTARIKRTVSFSD